MGNPKEDRDPGRGQDPGRRRDQRGQDLGREAGRATGRRGQGQDHTRRRVRRRGGQRARSPRRRSSATTTRRKLVTSRRRRRKTLLTWRFLTPPKNGTSSISTGLASRNIILSFYDNILAGLALFVGKMHKKHLTVDIFPAKTPLLHRLLGSVSFKSKVNQIFLSNMCR